MNETRDLGITLVVAALLLFGVAYLTQCSSATRHTEPALEEAPTGSKPTPSAAEERGEGGAARKSPHETAGEREDEERAKIRNVAHALQTIAASPELRATLGLPK